LWRRPLLTLMVPNKPESYKLQSTIAKPKRQLNICVNGLSCMSYFLINIFPNCSAIQIAKERISRSIQYGTPKANQHLIKI
jgi:hypothetical protein